MSTVFAITMIKNEADIIESFVRYHLNIVDSMVILDNGSTDNSRAILQNLMSEGLSVYLLDDEGFEFDQNEKMTRLMYETFETYGPDLIVPLDADEFLISSNDSDHPRDVWQDLDLSKWYYVRTRQYVPHNKDNPLELFIPRRIKHTYGDVGLYKVIVPKEVADHYAPALTMGNHSLQFPADSAEFEDLDSLRLAHFAFRTVEQAKSKIIVGWLNNIARPFRNKDDCFPWGFWFNLLKQKRSLDYSQLNDLVKDFYGDASAYMHPVNLSFCTGIELKYTGRKEVDAMKNLMEYAEKLAIEYAGVKRQQ